MKEGNPVNYGDYVRPGYAQERQQQHLAKMDAVLKVLRNCHQTLQTLPGDEARDLALQDIGSAYNNLLNLRKFTANKALPSGRILDMPSADCLDVALVE